MNRRIAAAIGAGLITAAAVAACSSSDDSDRGSQGVVASCDAITKIDTYRYAVSLKVEPPANGTPGTPLPGGSPAPLSAFADALSVLFSDFTLEGAYRAPDRSQAILRFQNEELELRSIGDDMWVRVGTQWQDTPTAEQDLMTPLVVCEEIVVPISPSLRLLEGEEESLYGVMADRYTAEQGEIGDLSDVLGDRLPEDYTVDVWLAQEGMWPLQLRIASPSEDSENGMFELTMHIRDINDAGITIDPPFTGPHTR